MARKWMQGLVAGCALWALAAGAAAAEPAVAPAATLLRHAVACPPFKGDSPLAAVYHAEMVKMLKATPEVEYLEGVRALVRRAPEFTFRVNGSIVMNEDGLPFVMVTLTDDARKEQIASHVAPASDDLGSLAAWRKTIQEDMARRASKLPFECRIRRQQGQESVSLDRGLGSGLEPGMVLYVSADEEPLISQATGEVIGRDSPRAAGQIEVFRVMENNAYARPVKGTQLPRTSRLYAKAF